MDREVIVPENVYKTGGFSQAIKVGNVVYVAAVVGIDDNGDISNDPETQATQMWINIKNILEAAGDELEDLVQITTYITKAEYGEKVLPARRKLWTREPQPTATLVVCTALAEPEYLIEANGIAVISKT